MASVGLPAQACETPAVISNATSRGVTAEVRGLLARGTNRLLGQSRQMESTRQQIRDYASHAAPVLITGETGTGKELVAQALHEESPRYLHRFSPINCEAIAESLLESELFGHEKGAFTGAERARLGIFEDAGGGTVFLDEIGGMTPRLQGALLRMLETGEARPVGANRSRATRCRIIAATNADLDTLCQEGRFRKDLLYRLRRLEVYIPPLRERREDILPLAEHFLREGRPSSEPPVMSEELKQVLLAHDWPGNVRELRNAIERMRFLGEDKLSYDVADLSLRSEPPQTTPQAVTSKPLPRLRPCSGSLERGEDEHLEPANENGSRRLRELLKVVNLAIDAELPYDVLLDLTMTAYRFVERTIVASRESAEQIGDLQNIKGAVPRTSGPVPQEHLPGNITKREAKKMKVADYWKAGTRNRKELARLIGCAVKTLYRFLKELGDAGAIDYYPKR